MIRYDIAAHGTVLWLEQYDKATYYINCSGITSGSKSRKMVSHMCG